MLIEQLLFTDPIQAAGSRCHDKNVIYRYLN